MENASKALIIAGAILIAILLIGLGVMIMRGANAPAEQADAAMKSKTLEMFNSEFEAYVGKNKTASEIKTLLSKIITSNQVNSDKTVKVKLNVPTGAYGPISDANTISSYMNHLQNQKKYKVEMKTYINGLVNQIDITEE